VRRNMAAIAFLVPALCLAFAPGGCGDSMAIFNPAFINTLVGGQVPVTPGPGAAFILVRCVNETDVPVRFIVTVERANPILSDDGTFELGDDGQVLTTRELDLPLELVTTAGGLGREIGALFSCGESPVTRLGLGQNLLRGDVAVFIDAQGIGGAQGFGVVADDLNPLTLEAGNFNCGDTIIFRAFEKDAVVGGVGLQTYRLRSSSSLRCARTSANIPVDSGH